MKSKDKNKKENNQCKKNIKNVQYNTPNYFENRGYIFDKENYYAQKQEYLNQKINNEKYGSIKKPLGAILDGMLFPFRCLLSIFNGKNYLMPENTENIDSSKNIENFENNYDGLRFISTRITILIIFILGALGSVNNVKLEPDYISFEGKHNLNIVVMSNEDINSVENIKKIEDKKERRNAFINRSLVYTLDTIEHVDESSCAKRMDVYKNQKTVLKCLAMQNETYEKYIKVLKQNESISILKHFSNKNEEYYCFKTNENNKERYNYIYYSKKAKSAILIEGSSNQESVDEAFENLNFSTKHEY